MLLGVVLVCTVVLVTKHRAHTPQIPNPELGPLERRVSLTYLDALQDDTFRQADIDYWFNEPEGVCILVGGCCFVLCNVS